MFNYTLFDDSKITYVQITNKENLPPNERLFIEVNGLPIVIFNIAGNLYAIGDVCTHDNGPLGDGEVDEQYVICPRHGARFDLRTGKALTLPAVVDIPAYKVRIIDDTIEVGLPEQD